MDGNSILVIGAAGYLGGHMVNYLRQHTNNVLGLDNLSRGHIEQVKSNYFFLADKSDSALISDICENYNVNAVFDFSEHTFAPHAIQGVQASQHHSVQKTKNLVETLIKNNVKYYIFSSSCDVYGNNATGLFSESSVVAPMNYYGTTKKTIEDLLIDVSQQQDFKFLSFRYFNVAGADYASGLGPRHYKKMHDISQVMRAARGMNRPISIYGQNHATRDGTYIRDYIHVKDVCQAHWLGLEWMIKNQESNIFNLSGGKGHSLLDVITAAAKICGRAIEFQMRESKTKLHPVLIADATHAQQTLGWRPEFSQLETLIEDSWLWELTRGAAARH